MSWFPSFSVEVTHTQLLPRTRQAPIQTSQLDNMVWSFLRYLLKRGSFVSKEMAQDEYTRHCFIEPVHVQLIGIIV